MCMFQPKMPDAPQLPPEPIQSKAPDAGAARSAAGRRTTDRVRGAADTILTSGQGVTQLGMTEKKTLLGQ